MSIRIYHNPRCSKSRQALGLLEDRGLEPRIIPYLETPPDRMELMEIIGELDVPASELVRTGEPAFEGSGLSVEDLDAETVASLIAEHPELLQRPVVRKDGRARIGRPPEQVLEILG